MQDYTLTNHDIDAACHEVETFCERANGEKKDILRTRLAVEEILLRYQESFGTKGTFQFQCRKRINRLYASFSIPGERNDVVHTDGGEESAILKGVLSGMGEIPFLRYGKQLSTGKTVNFLSEEMITPVFDTFMGLLSAVAGPLIFLSVAGGIYNIGDIATLGKVGKRMISRFLWMTLIFTTVFGIAILPLFPLAGSGGSSFRLSELLEMVLGIVPDNFFTPFLEGNPLQIIFLAALTGMAMLILGNRAGIVSLFLEQANAIILLIMENISAFVPVFIFGSLFNMILGKNFSVLLKAYKVPLVMLLGDVFLMAVYTGLVCIRKKVSAAVFLKKVFPVFLIGLTTASSAAAFMENRKVCEEKLGIDKKIVNIGVPLGQVVFMPGFSILYFVMGICMAEIYGVKISPVWLITALIIAVVLAVATPPIPEGALACYTILLLQLEIPAQAIVIAVAINVILDFFATAVDLFCLEAELTELAGDLEMLDVEKTRKTF